MSNLHHSLLNAFDHEVGEGLSVEGSTLSDVASAARIRCQEAFIMAANDAIIEGTDWE
jgi:hypothetical protein